MRFLLDTNIIINLEDNKELDSEFTGLLQIGGEHGCQFLVHPASKEDLGKDKDTERKKISLSKINKYPEIQNPAPILPQLVAHIKKDNDRIDFLLLTQVKYGYVDYLVTTDKDIKRMAKAIGCEKKIISPGSGYAIIYEAFKKIVPTHPVIHHGSTRELLPLLQTDFFDSLREDYDFDKWFVEKCAQQDRQCYYMKIEGDLCALLIYNIEPYVHEDHPFAEYKTAILKLCTLKVDKEGLGKKMGELFIGKMIHYCVENGVDHLYVTTFEKQSELIGLFQSFGFQNLEFQNKQEQTERVLYKILDKSHSGFEKCANLAIQHPYYTDVGFKKWVVPIQQRWFDILFKDSPTRQRTLFETLESSISEVAGNAIRKAYICNSTKKGLSKGDILYFYLSGGGFIQPIGILEEYTRVSSVEELKSQVKKISVFQDSELDNFFSGRKKVTILIFRLVTYLEVPIKNRRFDDLEAYKAKFVTISELSDSDYEKIKHYGGTDERFIINQA